MVISKKTINPVLIVFLAVLFLLGISCSRHETKTAPEVSGSPGASVGEKSSPKVRVITTIFPIYDMTRQVGGDEVEVRNLLPPGGSPHTYEPTVEDSQAVEDSDLIFMVGLGLDEWMSKLAETTGKSGMAKVVVLSSGIETQPLPRHEETAGETAHEEEAEEENHGHHHEAGAADPHIWMDPVRAKKIAENIRDALKKVKPESAEIFDENYNKYVKELDDLDKNYSEELSKFKKKDYVTFHSMLGYTAGRYGLNQVAVIAASPGKEPDPKHLIGIIETLKKYNVKVVFAEPQFSPKASESIAREINGTVVSVDPLGSKADPQRDTYIKNMEENLKALAGAFKKEND